MSNLIESGRNIFKKSKKLAVPMVAGLSFVAAADGVNAGGLDLPQATQDASHTLFTETPDLSLDTGLEFQDPTPIPDVIEIINPMGGVIEIPSINFDTYSSDFRYDSLFNDLEDMLPRYEEFMYAQQLNIDPFKIVVQGVELGGVIVPTPEPASENSNSIYIKNGNSNVLVSKTESGWNFTLLTESASRVYEAYLSSNDLTPLSRTQIDAYTPDTIKNNPDVQAPSSELLFGYYKIENGQILVWRPNLSLENAQDKNVDVESGWVVVEDLFVVQGDNQEHGMTWVLERRFIDTDKAGMYFSDTTRQGMQEITQQLFNQPNYDSFVVHVTNIGTFTPEKASPLFLQTLQTDFDQVTPLVALRTNLIGDHLSFNFYVKQYSPAEIEEYINQGWNPNVGPEQNIFEVVNEDTLNLAFGYAPRFLMVGDYDLTPARFASALMSGSFTDQITIINQFLPPTPIVNNQIDYSQMQSTIILPDVTFEQN